MERKTPGYMVKEESKIDKLRTRMGKRTIRYEEKLERGGGSEWARKCWEEIKQKEGRVTAGWEEQRREFYTEKDVGGRDGKSEIRWRGGKGGADRKEQESTGAKES